MFRYTFASLIMIISGIMSSLAQGTGNTLPTETTDAPWYESWGFWGTVVFLAIVCLVAWRRHENRKIIDRHRKDVRKVPPV